MGKYEVARRAVFLDSDRVFNRAFVRDGHPYPPSSVEDFELHDEAAPGCGRLKAAIFIRRGYEESLREVARLYSPKLQ